MGTEIVKDEQYYGFVNQCAREYLQSLGDLDKLAAAGKNVNEELTKLAQTVDEDGFTLLEKVGLEAIEAMSQPRNEAIEKLVKQASDNGKPLSQEEQDVLWGKYDAAGREIAMELMAKAAEQILQKIESGIPLAELLKGPETAGLDPAKTAAANGTADVDKMATDIMADIRKKLGIEEKPKA